MPLLRKYKFLFPCLENVMREIVHLLTSILVAGCDGLREALDPRLRNAPE